MYFPHSNARLPTDLYSQIMRPYCVLLLLLLCSLSSPEASISGCAFIHPHRLKKTPKKTPQIEKTIKSITP